MEQCKSDSSSLPAPVSSTTASLAMPSFAMTTSTAKSLLLTQQLPNLGVFERKGAVYNFLTTYASLEKGKYKLTGSFVAWCILHGGPGFWMLHPALYYMMVGRKSEDDILQVHVNDGDVLFRFNMLDNVVDMLSMTVEARTCSDCITCFASVLVLMQFPSLDSPRVMTFTASEGISNSTHMLP
ncbi:uncharacterized protein [Apostichopus japonicus]|uniref:uncharacterized protein n=1 Tax=Stichopus japonicus TaxID=307972 RepID=UPI003AB7A390